MRKAVIYCSGMALIECNIFLVELQVPGAEKAVEGCRVYTTLGGVRDGRRQ
jgi:hypothetical protein